MHDNQKHRRIGHAKECEWNERFKGKTWRDMPGSDEFEAKMNFFLFRRGLYVLNPANQNALGKKKGIEPIGGA